MSATISGINAVGKAENRLGKAVIILEGSFNYGAVYCFVNIDGLGMADYPAPVKVAHEAGNATIKVKGLFPIFSFILKRYFQPLVQVGHLS